MFQDDCPLKRVGSFSRSTWSRLDAALHCVLLCGNRDLRTGPEITLPTAVAVSSKEVLFGLVF